VGPAWQHAPALRGAVALVASAASLAVPFAARANGAFPAPFRIFAPEARPDEMIVTTNYGIVETLDGGRTWSWGCEHDVSEDAYLYQQAPAPSRRMLAISIHGLVFTDDGGCSWTLAAGQPSDAVITDYFVDPTSANRVFVVLRRNVNDVLTFSLVASNDGGSSFPSQPIYEAPLGTSLDSFEVARSDPSRMYATLSSLTPNGMGPWLARSRDGGASFVTADVSSWAGAGMLRIATIDPANPERMFLRLERPDRDAVLVSDDGGRTLTNVFAADPGLVLSAFLLRRDGTIFVATMDVNSVVGRVHRSTDGGTSFVTISDSLHSGSLVERGGSLFVLGDGTRDPFLVGVSRDNADTPFQPVLRPDQVMGVKACAGRDLRPACAATCMNLETIGLFSAAVCTTPAGPGAPDGGTERDGSADATPAASRASGGFCSVSAPSDSNPSHQPPGFALGLVVASTLAAAVAVSRRSKR
jgi:hypothetical protein